jgi:hypothetical protein
MTLAFFKKTLRRYCISFAAIFFLAACSPKLDWRVVQSPQERYTALFPGKPEKIQRRIAYQDQEFRRKESLYTSMLTKPMSSKKNLNISGRIANRDRIDNVVVRDKNDKADDGEKLHSENISIEKASSQKPLTKSIRRSGSFLHKRFSNEDLTKDDEPEEVFNRDPDLVQLRRHVTEDFIDLFTKGVNNYVSGDWLLAKKYLEECNEIMKNKATDFYDGPSLTLLKYMATHQNIKPITWEGYRPLTSK